MGTDAKVALHDDGHKDFYNTPTPIRKNATEKEKLEYARVVQKYREVKAKLKQLLDKSFTDYKSNDSIYIDKNSNRIYRLDK